MAIYHFSAQVVKRSSGASAVAGAAYRAGDELFDERTAELKDYKNKSGVIHSEILMPENAPAAFADRGTLWNAVEAAENRKDAQLAREINVAIPNELTKDQGVALVRNFVTEQMVNLGMIADVNHHEAHSKKDMNNHAHIMLTMRDVGPDGFGLKNRDWNDKALVENWRAEWANHANKALAEAGHDARIDHRSFKDQGITDLQPTIHIGPAATAMEARGVKTIVGDINRGIEEYNNNVIELASTHEKMREALADKAFNDSYIGEVTSEIDNEDADREVRNDNKEYLKTLDLVFVKDPENGQFIWKNQFEQNEKRIVAFVEHVDKITAHSNNKTALKAMAQASVAKFGNNFKVTGGNEFRREMWLQGSLLGANVSGYEPTAKDIDDLQKRADDYKSQYKKDIVFDSKVEEMLLLRYAESLKERQEQQMLVNERNPQQVEIKPIIEEVKNDGRNRNRDPEKAFHARPGLGAFKQGPVARHGMQKLSEFGLDARTKLRTSGILQSDVSDNLQRGRKGPAEGLRWQVADKLEPKPVPKPEEVPEIDGKAVLKGALDNLTKFRSKQPQSAETLSSEMSRAKNEIDRIAKERTASNDLSRDLGVKLTLKRQEKVDTAPLKTKAYEAVVSAEDRRERFRANKAFKEISEQYENASMISRLMMRKDLKAAEERKANIAEKIDEASPRINKLLSQFIEIEQAGINNQITKLKNDIDQAEKDAATQKEAIDKQQELLNKAREDLEQLDPDLYKVTMLKLGLETEIDGEER